VGGSTPQRQGGLPGESECYGYSRDQNFIDKQTVDTGFIYTVPENGQYMAIKHNCSQNSNNYNQPFPFSINVPQYDTKGRLNAY
jgi:hypothetical protein